MSEELKQELAKALEDADLFRSAVESVKTGGCAYTTVWAMVPVDKAKEAGLI